MGVVEGMAKDQAGMNFIQKFRAGLLFFREYPKFQRESFRDALKYILVLGLIVGAPTVLPHAMEDHRVAGYKLKWIEEKVPEFKIDGGKLSVIDKTPVVDKENGGVFALDTTGKLNADTILKDYSYGLVLTEDRMFNKDITVKEKLYSALQKQLMGKALSKEDLIRVLGLRMMGVYSFLNYLIKYYLELFFIALVISLCGLVAGKVLAVKLRLADLYRLTLFALTLPMVFALLVSLLPVRSMLFAGIYFALASVFLIRAVVGMNDGEMAKARPKRG
jgi:hypothetical protein